MKFVLATHNAGKVAELRAILQPAVPDLDLIGYTGPEPIENGTTFAEKYTDVGLKQIAANILQARHANVLNDPTKSFTYNGSLFGAANATTDLSFPSKSLLLLGTGGGGVAPQNFIPKDYLGNVPYPILNEIGVTVVAGHFGDFKDKVNGFYSYIIFANVFGTTT